MGSYDIVSEELRQMVLPENSDRAYHEKMMKEREQMSMYQDEYKKWLDADLIDFDLKKELQHQRAVCGCA